MESPNPLTELTHVKQTEPGIFRRAFVDGDNDLTVWYSLDKRLVGFQLSIYDIAMTYTDGKLRVQKVDYCEKDNLAPVLRERIQVDVDKVVEYLKANDDNLDRELMEYMLGALEGR